MVAEVALTVPFLRLLLASALNSGYIDVASDSGHQGGILDGTWALNDRQAVVLYGQLSVPTVMASAREIVKTFYGQVPAKNYFEGCSNGGREALIQVQRFPTLFDGVIAGAPAYNPTAMVGAFQRNAKAIATRSSGSLSNEKVSMVAAAVRQACDALDGIADGIVSNPAACHFDPKTLRCPGGADTGAACLSDTQLDIFKTWNSPSSYDGGTYQYSGWPLTGNEDLSWPGWVLPQGSSPLRPGPHADQPQRGDQIGSRLTTCYSGYIAAKHVCRGSLGVLTRPARVYSGWYIVDVALQPRDDAPNSEGSGSRRLARAAGL